MKANRARELTNNNRTKGVPNWFFDEISKTASIGLDFVSFSSDCELNVDAMRELGYDVEDLGVEIKVSW